MLFPDLDIDDIVNPKSPKRPSGIPGVSYDDQIAYEDEQIIKKKKEEEEKRSKELFNDAVTYEDPNENVPQWQKDFDRDVGLSGGRTLAKGKAGVFNEGPLKGKTKGQAYEEYRSRGEGKGGAVKGPTRTAVYSSSGEILSTGTNRPIAGSGLIDRGSADVRRARMDQEAARRVERARAAVQERKVQQQDQREYDNMMIAKNGYLTKDGVTRFYDDEARKAAAISAQASQEAQTLAKNPDRMDEARAMAQQSMKSDRSSAISSPGRATVVKIDPQYVPFGSPGYGVGGVSLVDDKSSDTKTGSGMGMSLDVAKGIRGGASIPGIDGSGLGQAAGSALSKDAGDRIGSAIRDTVVDQYKKSGGIPGLSSPEAMAKKSSAPTPTAPMKKKKPQMI